MSNMLECYKQCGDGFSNAGWEYDRLLLLQLYSLTGFFDDDTHYVEVIDNHGVSMRKHFAIYSEAVLCFHELLSLYRINKTDLLELNFTKLGA